MNTKTRDISPYNFLQALQKEYICLEIRSKIYLHTNDKQYFRKLMVKKESAIQSLSRKNRLENIIDNSEEYLRVWQEIVPKFGFPNLIYNIINVTEKQLKFPYRGTVVKDRDGRIGISQQVNNEDRVVILLDSGLTIIVPLDEVERLDHRETDEYFYYYPGNEFQCDLGSEYDLGKLNFYDIENKTATFSFKDCEKLITLHQSKISRIL